MNSKFESYTFCEELTELFTLLSQLSKEDRNKVHGVVIGMKLAREVQNDKKIS